MNADETRAATKKRLHGQCPAYVPVAERPSGGGWPGCRASESLSSIGDCHIVACMTTRCPPLGRDFPGLVEMGDFKAAQAHVTNTWVTRVRQAIPKAAPAPSPTGEANA